MEFRVMSRHMAEQYVSQKHDEKYAVISISNVRGDRAFLQKIAVPDCGMIACLNLAFDDVYIGESYGVAMTDVQAQAIIAFVESKLDKVDFFIVHCEAGRSRSAGVAAALSKWINGEDWDYFLDPKYTPNSYCYQTILEWAFLEKPITKEDKEEILHKITVNQNLDCDWDVVYDKFGVPIEVKEIYQ